MLRETLQEHIQDGEIKIQDDEFSLVEVVGVIEKEASTDFDCMVNQITEHDLIQDLAEAIVRRDHSRVLAVVEGLEGYADNLLKETTISLIHANFEDCHE